MRIVQQNTTCLPNETSLSWNIQGLPGPQGPPGPAASPSAEIGGFLSNDFSNKTIPCTLGIAGCLSLRFKNFFTNSKLEQVDFGLSDLSGANFTGADLFLGGLSSIKANGTIFVSTNLRNVNMQLTDFSGDDFSNADLSNLSGSGASLNGAKFVNANFTNANLRGAQGAWLADFTGAIWSNTTCPDGTNSNSNGGTCQGHLVFP